MKDPKDPKDPEPFTLTAPPGPPPEGISLATARRNVEIRREGKAGVLCPCCDQLAKVYKRRIYKTVARQFLTFAKAALAGGWVDVRSIAMRGGDFAKLAYWGLIEERQKDPDDKDRRTSGWWRLTEKGRQFAENATTVPTFAHVYNGRVVRFSGPPASIVSALGSTFVYADLWK